MKLLFTKDANNEINVQLQKGTVVEEFTYVEMVRQLLESKKFDNTDFTTLSAEEQKKIQGMLDKIEQLFREEDEAQAQVEPPANAQ